MAQPSAGFRLDTCRSREGHMERRKDDKEMSRNWYFSRFGKPRLRAGPLPGERRVDAGAGQQRRGPKVRVNILQAVSWSIMVAIVMALVLLSLGSCQSSAPKWSMYRLDKDYNWKRVK